MIEIEELKQKLKFALSDEINFGTDGTYEAKSWVFADAYNTAFDVATTAIRALERKDKLLAEALEQLLACEWEVSLSVIVKIQKELGTTEG